MQARLPPPCTKECRCLLTALLLPPPPPLQALTLFDEARCRGADLHLRPDAVGLLTLGPSTCKDKLMQAAGRMCKLGGWGLRAGRAQAGGALCRGRCRLGVLWRDRRRLGEPAEPVAGLL